MTGNHKLRIGWVGFHEEGELAFNSLLDKGYDICGAVTLDDKSISKRSGTSDYLERCPKLGIPLLKTTHINDDESFAWLTALNLDILIVLGWSQILSPRILNIAKIGTIGAHASLLPSLRGSAPINWAIIKGLKQTGNSLIELVEQVDEGKIIEQVAFSIEPFDTCRSLYRKVAESNAEMLLRALPKISELGSIPGVLQQRTNESLLSRRKPADGLIDWHNSAQEIYNLVRAVTRPYPGAFTYLNNQKVMVWSATLLPIRNTQTCKPGQIIGPVFSDREEAAGLLVQCGKSSVLVINELETDVLYCGHELAKKNWKGFTFGDV